MNESPSFAKTYLLPVAWVFVVPLISLVFSSYYLSSWTKMAKRSYERAALQSFPQGPSPEQMEKLQAFLASIDLRSAALNECGVAGFFSSPTTPGVSNRLCSSTLQFVWVQGLSLGLIVLALLVMVWVAGMLMWARRSSHQQHQAFMMGWWGMKAFGTLHVIGQGLLVLFLSYWLTALWFKVFFVKLILVAVILVFVVMGIAIKALFAKDTYMHFEHGAKLERDQAPRFFEHMDQLAQEMNTKPPEHVVVGIDDKFFVTEGNFTLVYGDQVEVVDGRALYMSLPLMRVLEKDELSAVLAHELGHFFAGDTAQQRKLNVVYRRFLVYLAHMSETITWGVNSCMVAFGASFEVVIQANSRVAEFAADKHAATCVGERPAGMALLKIVAYSIYRAKTESDLLESMEHGGVLKIEERVRSGFLRSLAEVEQRRVMLQQSVVHPFDSHPPLRDRLINLGLESEVEGMFEDHEWESETQSTWWDEVHEAQVIEQAMWDQYEAQFQVDHELLIAYRLVPKTPEDVAYVSQFFPPQEFLDKKDEEFVSMDWEGLTYLDKGEERRVLFEQVKDVQRKEGTVHGEYLVFRLEDGVKHKVNLRKFGDVDWFLRQFADYWQRHQVSANQEP